MTTKDLRADDFTAGQAPTGTLMLRIAERLGRSVALEQFHQGTLRVMSPHYLDDSGQVCYAVINPGGGYLGGDEMHMDITVEDGASLLLTTQAATKVYRTPTSPARQVTRMRLGANAVLESLPDQMIVYREGRYEQTTIVEVDPTASYIAAEVITPGWSPDGRPFGYHRVSLRTEIIRPGESSPVLVDALVLEPPADDVAGLGGLEGFSHLGSLLVVDARVDVDLVSEVHAMTNVNTVRVGISLAPGPALVLRVLGNDTETVTNVLFEVDALMRRRWFNQDPVALRKY